MGLHLLPAQKAGRPPGRRPDQGRQERGIFPGGSEIILPYDTIEFTDVEMNGQKHTNTNASATLTILQIQDGAYKTVWPMDIADAEIQYPATYE